MTFAAILGFLIANGGSIVAAGLDISKIVAEVIALFPHHGSTISRDDFHKFVDTQLGDNTDELDTIIARAKMA